MQMSSVQQLVMLWPVQEGTVDRKVWSSAEMASRFWCMPGVTLFLTAAAGEVMPEAYMAIAAAEVGIDDNGLKADRGHLIAAAEHEGAEVAGEKLASPQDTYQHKIELACTAQAAGEGQRYGRGMSRRPCNLNVKGCAFILPSKKHLTRGS